MNILLPNEIISKIFFNSGVKCHTCHKIFNFNFYKKLDKNYYCCKECFDFV